MDISKPSVPGLAWLLRHREAWPKSFQRWDFSSSETCAMGLAAAQWNNGKIWGPVTIAKVLNISEANSLDAFVFLPESSGTAPEDVAAALESFP